MRLENLKEEGFLELSPFDLVWFGPQGKQEYKAALNSTGVYVFGTDYPFPRLLGNIETDILYIGCAGRRTGSSIAQRMNNYRIGHPKAPQDKRIKDALEKLVAQKKQRIRFFYKPLGKVGEPCEESRNIEKRLLHEFFLEHLDHPPLNRSA
jgi:hypothetical protein